MRLLEGKVLVVTGAAQGIGEGVAVHAARHGAAVVCADIQEEDLTVKMVEAEDAPVTRLVMDGRKSEDWERLIATVTEEFGGDLLANVAGVVNKLSLDNVVELTEEVWEEVLDTELKGCLAGNARRHPGHDRPGWWCASSTSRRSPRCGDCPTWRLTPPPRAGSPP